MPWFQSFICPELNWNVVVNFCHFWCSKTRKLCVTKFFSARTNERVVNEIQVKFIWNWLAKWLHFSCINFHQTKLNHMFTQSQFRRLAFVWVKISIKFVDCSFGVYQSIKKHWVYACWNSRWPLNPDDFCMKWTQIFPFWPTVIESAHRAMCRLLVHLFSTDYRKLTNLIL